MTANRTYWLLLASLAILAIHWASQLTGTYELMFDESQYWFWAKHPAWGYYSKPPMIGWLMTASTAVFGDGNFGVRMLSPLLSLATGGIMYATARRLNYSSYIAAWVCVTYVTLPVVTGGGTFFTTDVPLRFFWSIALYGVISTVVTGNGRYWLLTGIAAGFGLLSKYTMIAFGASCLLSMLVIPGLRPQLRSVWPWAGAILAMVILAPNIVWNMHHHFVTFTHTNDNVFSKHVEIYPEDMLGFMLGQLGIFGPILLVSLLAGMRGLKRSDTNALLYCFVWPLAIAGIIVSLLAGAQAHWISPVYIAATLIVVPWLFERKPLWLSLSFALSIALLILMYATPAILPHLHLKKDPLARLFVWNQVSQEVRPLVVAYPNALLITNERKIAAALTYQLRDVRGYDTPIYKWDLGGPVRDHYDLLTRQADLSGKTRMFILRETELNDIAPHRKARLLKRFTLQKYRFSVYLLSKGIHDPS